MITVILLALLPAAGNIAGGVLVEVVPPAARWRNPMLHMAIGVVIAVVALEIMPDAVDVLDRWQIAAAFTVGGALYVLIRAGVARVVPSGRSRMWMIYVAVAADLFGDGLMIGAGASVGTSVGVTLALGQVLADVPEGAASVLTFRSNGVGRSRRLLISMSFAAPALAGAMAAYLALRGRPESWQFAALVITAGLFVVAVIEDLVEEAHEGDDETRASVWAVLAGFVVFALLSGAL